MSRKRPKANDAATPTPPEVTKANDDTTSSPPAEDIETEATAEDIETEATAEDIETEADIAAMDAISDRLGPTIADHQAELDRLRSLDTTHQDFCPVRLWQLCYLVNGEPIPQPC